MSSSTVNVVKYFFRKRFVPADQERLKQFVVLAYRTATANQLYPQEVFIRSDVHNTTMIDGKVQKDPKGPHVTISYKTRDQQGRETHVACHGYVKDATTLEFKDSTEVKEKPDSVTLRTGQPAWPQTEELFEAPEVGYGHIPSN